MYGELFEYEKGLCAFDTDENPGAPNPSILILIGGLSDGLFTIPYANNLAHEAGNEGLSLVQIFMKSSYNAYGMSSIDEDVECIIKLIKHLKEKRNAKSITLLGHSTGCQDIMRLLGKWNQHKKLLDGLVIRAILQAPVSDREYAFSSDPVGTAALLEWANSTNDLQAMKLVDNVPMTAYRIKALYERLGDDDYFSTDLTVEERRSKLAFSPIPIKVVFSGKDEYFPDPGHMEPFLQSLKEAWPQITSVQILLDADHGITDQMSQREFFDTLVSFSCSSGSEYEDEDDC